MLLYLEYGCCLLWCYVVEWYGVCNFVVFSVVEICAAYGGVYMFHACFDVCVVYSVVECCCLSLVVLVLLL